MHIHYLLFFPTACQGFTLFFISDPCVYMNTSSIFSLQLHSIDQCSGLAILFGQSRVSWSHQTRLQDLFCHYSHKNYQNQLILIHLRDSISPNLPSFLDYLTILWKTFHQLMRFYKVHSVRGEEGFLFDPSYKWQRINKSKHFQRHM